MGNPSYSVPSSKSKSNEADETTSDNTIWDFFCYLNIGDILIYGGPPSSGFVQTKSSIGHAALVVKDHSILEMTGVTEGKEANNNRKVRKDIWYRECKDSGVSKIQVWRVPVKHETIATNAADWAYRTFYNKDGGDKKTEHVAYSLHGNFNDFSKCYCSGLVIQAYFFGNPDIDIIKPGLQHNFFLPTRIPSYFREEYALVKKGTF